jgi:hypothetical protein
LTKWIKMQFCSLALILLTFVPQSFAQNNQKTPSLGENQANTGQSNLPIVNPPAPAPAPAPSKIPPKTTTTTTPGVSASRTYVPDTVRELRLGDRTFVANFLKSMFGTKSNDLISSEILQNTSAYGGVCNLYDGDTGCDAFTDQSTQSSWTIVRQASITKTCEQLLDDDENVKFALNRLGLSQASKPTVASIKVMYESFFLGDVPTQDQLNQLTLVSNVSKTPFESYRLLLLAMCLIPDWQVP